MKKFLIEKLELHKKLMKNHIDNHEIKKAFETEIIINLLKQLIEEFDSELDLKEVIREHYYTSKQVAKKINKSHATVIRQAQLNKLDSIKIGRDYFFKKKKVDNISKSIKN